MTLTSREMVLKAMRLEDPGQIPVFCQLAIGHTLLNSDVGPVEYNFTNDGYARGLLQVRELYDFDGILLHKPGRDAGVRERTRVESHPDGPLLVFEDGGKILCTNNDDPKFWPPKGWLFPGFARADNPDSIEALRQLTGADPLAEIPPSYRDWCLHKGLHFFTRIEDIPEHYYGAIDQVLAASAGRWSIHGEVKAPMDYLMNILGIENALVAFIMDPDLCHAFMAKANEAIITWALAQLRRGCDAIKISSPFAGGGFISRDHYLEFVKPHEQKLAQAVRAAGGIIYTHTCGAIGDRLDLIAETGVNGIETLDPPPLGNVHLRDAKAQYGKRIFFKGNLDSVNVLLRGTKESVRQATQECLEIGSPGGGYILSTACSVAPAVAPDNIKVMVETVRAFSARRN